MNFHPLAELFPLMQGREFDELVADIKANGLREAIWTYQGQILDGRNRWRACEAAQLAHRPMREYAGADPVGFVVSLNLHRRHLTEGQKAALALDLLPLLEARAKERMLAAQNNRAATEIFPEQAERAEAREQAARMAGTNPRYVSDAKKLAKESAEVFERVRSGELSIPAAKKMVKKELPAAHAMNVSREYCTTEDLADLPAAGFATIYADPPWQYSNQGTRASQDNHYVGMAVDEICALPIAPLAAANAHLHLWTTNAFLFESKRVMEAWGFEYKSCFVWVKSQIGMGNYWRVSHEYLLLGVRGSLPFADKTLRSWLEHPRGQHSAKPERIRDLIQRASPGPRLELFARRPVEGWTCWGNEIKRGGLFAA